MTTNIAEPATPGETLPCGCRTWTDEVDGQPVFMFEPHALDCEWYAFVLEQSAAQGKPVTTVDIR